MNKVPHNIKMLHNIVFHFIFLLYICFICDINEGKKNTHTNEWEGWKRRERENEMRELLLVYFCNILKCIFT